MRFKTPRIITPDFWLANLGDVSHYLRHRLKLGAVEEFGRSALGHPLHVVEYANPGAVKLMVIGGTHGHEPGGVASVMNLIHLLESGEDLNGQAHDPLLDLAGRAHLLLVPCLNPDGRSVCPDSFYAQGIDTVTAWASGIRRDGSLVPYDADSSEPCYYHDPEDAFFVGGQFNGAGWAMNRRLSDDHSEAVEVQALLDYCIGREIDAILDLHACGYNFAFQVRSHQAPYWPIMREWQRRAEVLFVSKGRQLKPLHGDGDPPQPPDFFFNSSLLHKHARLIFMAFEGRQGLVGRRSFFPMPTEWEIIDDYLGAIEVFFELGVEGHYSRTNAEVFGG